MGVKLGLSVFPNRALRISGQWQQRKLNNKELHTLCSLVISISDNSRDGQMAEARMKHGKSIQNVSRNI
jgi:hypothetical protein